MGVPVRPKRNAFGSAARIFMPRSPSCVRCASSTRATMLPRSLSTPSASPNLKMVVMMILRVSCLSSFCRSSRVSAFTRFGHVGGVEGGADLRVEVDAVDDDDDRRVAELGLQPELLRGEHHEQRLARALEVPDEALARLARRARAAR